MGQQALTGGGIYTGGINPNQLHLLGCQKINQLRKERTRAEREDFSA
jgi:hypothetical protein